MKYKLTIQEQTFDIEIGAITGDVAEVTVDHKPYKVRIEGSPAATFHPAAAAPKPVAAPAVTATPAAAPARQVSTPDGADKITAPIPGVILSIDVQVGDRVAPGQVVAIMEAMKMENNMVSHIAGTVTKILLAKGAEVATGDVIMVIE